MALRARIYAYNRHLSFDVAFICSTLTHCGVCDLSVWRLKWDVSYVHLRVWRWKWFSCQSSYVLQRLWLCRASDTVFRREIDSQRQWGYGTCYGDSFPAAKECTVIHTCNAVYVYGNQALLNNISSNSAHHGHSAFKQTLRWFATALSMEIWRWCWVTPEPTVVRWMCCLPSLLLGSTCRSLSLPLNLETRLWLSYWGLPTQTGCMMCSCLSIITDCSLLCPYAHSPRPKETSVSRHEMANSRVVCVMSSYHPTLIRVKPALLNQSASPRTLCWWRWLIIEYVHAYIPIQTPEEAFAEWVSVSSYSCWWHSGLINWVC